MSTIDDFLKDEGFNNQNLDLNTALVFVELLQYVIRNNNYLVAVLQGQEQIKEMLKNGSYDDESVKEKVSVQLEALEVINRRNFYDVLAGVSK